MKREAVSAQPPPPCTWSTVPIKGDKRETEELSRRRKEKTWRMLRRLFNSFDENGDGMISPEELCKCVQSGVDLQEHLSMEEAVAIVSMLDSNNDGLLDLDDFSRLMECECGRLEEDLEEEECRSLRGAFEVYQMEDQGCITPKSLCRALRRLGQGRTLEECAAMIRRFDINGDGVISFDEFRIMMH